MMATDTPTQLDAGSAVFNRGVDSGLSDTNPADVQPFSSCAKAADAAAATIPTVGFATVCSVVRPNSSSNAAVDIATISTDTSAGVPSRATVDGAGLDATAEPGFSLSADILTGVDVFTSVIRGAAPLAVNGTDLTKQAASVGSFSTVAASVGSVCPSASEASVNAATSVVGPTAAEPSFAASLTTTGRIAGVVDACKTVNTQVAASLPFTCCARQAPLARGKSWVGPRTSSTAALSPPAVYAAGNGGVAELRQCVDDGDVCWALLRFQVGSGTSVRTKFVALHCNGDKTPTMRRGLLNGRTSAAMACLGEVHASLVVTRAANITVEQLCERLLPILKADHLNYRVEDLRAEYVSMINDVQTRHDHTAERQTLQCKVEETEQQQNQQQQQQQHSVHEETGPAPFTLAAGRGTARIATSAFPTMQKRRRRWRELSSANALHCLNSERGDCNWVLLEPNRFAVHDAGRNGLEEIVDALDDDLVLFGVLRLSFAACNDRRNSRAKLSPPPSPLRRAASTGRLASSDQEENPPSAAAALVAIPVVGPNSATGTSLFTKHVLVHWVGPTVGVVKRGLWNSRLQKAAEHISAHCAVSCRIEAHRREDISLEDIVAYLRRLTVVDGICGNISVDAYLRQREAERASRELSNSGTAAQHSADQAARSADITAFTDDRVKDANEICPVSLEQDLDPSTVDLATAVRAVREPAGAWNWVLCGWRGALLPSASPRPASLPAIRRAQAVSANLKPQEQDATPSPAPMPTADPMQPTLEAGTASEWVDGNTLIDDGVGATTPTFGDAAITELSFAPTVPVPLASVATPVALEDTDMVAAVATPASVSPAHTAVVGTVPLLVATTKSTKTSVDSTPIAPVIANVTHSMPSPLLGDSSSLMATRPTFAAPAVSPETMVATAACAFTEPSTAPTTLAVAASLTTPTDASSASMLTASAAAASLASAISIAPAGLTTLSSAEQRASATSWESAASWSPCATASSPVLLRKVDVLGASNRRSSPNTEKQLKALLPNSTSPAASLSSAASAALLSCGAVSLSSPRGTLAIPLSQRAASLASESFGAPASARKLAKSPSVRSRAAPSVVSTVSGPPLPSASPSSGHLSPKVGGSLGSTTHAALSPRKAGSLWHVPTPSRGGTKVGDRTRRRSSAQEPPPRGLAFGGRRIS
eukprot:TRINITY_DN20223_c0_g1_i2.p1 TRINITY_DN20223_c0_g1~~TRINITY_DN20223_c0_g1_i2.p1  ORF type:complete len:1278 (-),score=243.26 TRINITY_DN20223_c0_g1_i2:208-3717(-)